jgi:hypothetical protein
LLVEFSSIAIKIKEPIIGTSRRDVIMDCIYYMFSFSPGPPHAPLGAEQGLIREVIFYLYFIQYILIVFYFFNIGRGCYAPLPLPLWEGAEQSSFLKTQAPKGECRAKNKFFKLT